MNECSQFLPSFDVRFVTSFFCTFCPFSSCKFFFFFLAFFFFPPSLPRFSLFLMLFIFRAVFCLTFYISPFIPSFSPISFSVYFPSFFSRIALFLFSFRFRISVSAIFTSCFRTLFLRCSPISAYSALFLISVPSADSAA
jgi:hypothetical protein